MASEQAPVPHGSDTFAVAFVVESSLVVANDWLRIIKEYISPMLRRLSEANPGCKPRLAFITYATADTLPTPILCKRFFVDHQPVTKEMKDTPMNLGIGSTNSGGSRGMAALEGLVAAMELFDILHSVPPQGRPRASHIFHVASTIPDASLHPQWNDSPHLDSMTWEEMPAELNKRNISFSTINLRPNLTRFSDIHSAIAPGAPKEPWFPTRSPHSVLLAGFPMSPQKGTPILLEQKKTKFTHTISSAVKRPGDVHTTPDPKRARLAHTAVDGSPKAAAPKTPSNQPKPSPLLPPQLRAQPPTQTLLQPTAQAPAQVPGNVGTNPALPNYNLSNLMTAVKTVEEQIRTLGHSVQNAKNSGNTSLADNLQQEIIKKHAVHQTFKVALIAYSKNNPQLQSAAQAQTQNQTAHEGEEAQMTGPSVQKTLPEATHPPNQFEGRVDPHAHAAQLGHNRTASGSGPKQGVTQTRPPMPQVPSAALAAQMQKMVDQQQRARPMQSSQNMTGLPNVNMSMKPVGPSSDQHLVGMGPSTIWQGTLSYSGTDQLGNKKETVVWVVANTPNITASRVETWPTAMMLMPAREPAVPYPELQGWLKRHQPVLCSFMPQTHNIPDPAGNEANLKSLAGLLIARNAYAVAAWTLPSGEQGNNIIFFPVNGTSLGGACFPVTGIPDMPRSSQPMANVPGIDPTNPEWRARLNAMTPEQRDGFMNHVKQQRALQVHRQQNLPQGVGAPGNNPGTNNALMSMNAMNMAAQNQQQQQHADMSFGGNVPPSGNYGGMGIMSTMGSSQQQAMMAAGMPRPVNTGMRNPVPSSINYEMLQSFIQRNPDGGGPGMAQ